VPGPFLRVRCPWRALGAAFVLATLGLSCRGSDPKSAEPPAPPEPPQAPWAERWLGSFVAYLPGSPPEAMARCTALAEVTGSAWQGRSLFTLELTPSGVVERDFSAGQGASELAQLQASSQARYCWITPGSTDARALAAAPWNQLLDWVAEAGAELTPDVPSTLPLSLGVAAGETAKLAGATVGPRQKKRMVRNYVFIYIFCVDCFFVPSSIKPLNFILQMLMV